MLKKILTNPFVFFSITALLVLWPLALCVFTVKNDALTFYYPVRALISDALNNSELPLWTPFINFGYPLHADMQSGAWNPVVWLFSYLTHFSLAGFHLELLLYFILAGAGFYYLCRQYRLTTTTALAFGLAYQCSGFMIDSVQFYTCISSACWLPYIFLYYKKMLESNRISHALFTALFLYLLFTGGYPSLSVVTCYLLLAHLLWTFFCNTNKIAFIKTMLLPLTILAIAFIVCSLPAILSFANHLAFIDRGKTQTLSFVLENSLPPAALFSFVSPFATTANSAWLATDPLMRNIYLGILPLIFVLYGVVSRQVKIKGEARFFLVAAIIMGGMALGSFFFLRQAAYYALPLMDTFRHPATMRLFTIFFLLLFGAYAFNIWQQQNTTATKKEPQKIMAILALLLLLVAIALLIKNTTQVKMLVTLPGTASIKSIVQSLSFTQRFFIQLPLVAGTLVALYFLIKRKSLLYLAPILVFIDMGVAAQLNIPVTVIGAAKFKEVETALARNPVAFPIPSVTSSIQQNSLNSASAISGSKLHYSKKIGRNDFYITPGNLSTQEKMYESPIKDYIFTKPVVFLEGDSMANTIIHAFGANYIQLEVQNHAAARLIYLQNNYPGWQVLNNNKELPIETAYETFISVKLPAGLHRITIQYKPGWIYITWYISVSSLALITLYLLYCFFFKNRQQRNTHWQSHPL